MKEKDGDEKEIWIEKEEKRNREIKSERKKRKWGIERENKKCVMCARTCDICMKFYRETLEAFEDQSPFYSKYSHVQQLSANLKLIRIAHEYLKEYLLRIL